MAHSYTSKLAVAALGCGAFTALALSSFAGADARNSERFAGVCEMSGVIRHEPPMTQEPAPTKVHGSFRGVCSGRLTDRRGRTRRLKGAPARYEGRGAGALSCLGGTAPGTGRLLFGRGRRIDFRLTERRTPGLAVVTLRGAASGSATVRGTVSRSEDLAKINERCNGSGLRLLRGDARITSPGISG
jgi:hypothetical protein